AARRPSASPLFPYTTLFRSRLDHIAGKARVLADDDAMTVLAIAEIASGRHAERQDAIRRHRPRISEAAHAVGAENLAFPRRRRRDRKSTRLNSSHVKISYAV